jgi:hypothetical protein
VFQEVTSPPVTTVSHTPDSQSEVTSLHSSEVPDIGVLLKSGSLHSLPQSMKLKIINHTPNASHNYPKRYMHGCNRQFKVEWVRNHPWLHYSSSEDGVYCKACALFAPRDIRQQKLGVLVTKPFSVWTKKSSTFRSHEELQYHQDSMTRMVAFKDSCSDPTQNVACLLNKAHEDQVARNVKVMKSLLKCVCFCGKQVPF